MKTYYLWDIANTLFVEKWNKELTGLNSYDEYVESLGNSLNSITPLEYEQMYQKPYEDGFYDIILPENLVKTLTWTKCNGLFTTGTREQIDWRHKQIIPRYGVDIRPLIMNIFTTFDYAPVNQKTEKMLVDVISKIINQGFDRLVYIDDKIANCELFIKVAESCQKNNMDFRFIVYNINYRSKKPRKLSDIFYKICSLQELIQREMALESKLTAV